MSWYNFPITQAYNPGVEQGVDIGTPFHTPITAPYGGTVVVSNYQTWGGDVGVNVNLPGVGQVVEYFQHLDQNLVSVGDVIQPGQLIGLSGGQLTGGLHPATTGSTGPHTEFGFGPEWIPGSKNFDPTPYLQGGSVNNPVTQAVTGGTATVANTANSLNLGNGFSIPLPSNDVWIRTGLVLVGIILLVVGVYGLVARPGVVVEESGEK